MLRNFSYSFIYQKIHDPENGQAVFQISQVKLMKTSDADKRTGGSQDATRIPQNPDFDYAATASSPEEISAQIERLLNRGQIIPDQYTEMINEAIEGALPTIQKHLLEAQRSSEESGSSGPLELETFFQALEESWSVKDIADGNK